MQVVSTAHKWPADFPTRLLAMSGPIGMISGNEDRAPCSNSGVVLQIIQSASFTNLLFFSTDLKIIFPAFEPLKAAKISVLMVGIVGDRVNV